MDTYSPHLLYSGITTECYSELMVFPAGVLGYMPRPGAKNFESATTPTEFGVSSFGQFKHEHV